MKYICKKVHEDFTIGKQYKTIPIISNNAQFSMDGSNVPPSYLIEQGVIRLENDSGGSTFFKKKGTQFVFNDIEDYFITIDEYRDDIIKKILDE